jgi:hypothetical protein
MYWDYCGNGISYLLSLFISATKINKLNNSSLFENEFLLTQQTSKILIQNISIQQMII